MVYCVYEYSHLCLSCRGSYFDGFISIRKQTSGTKFPDSATYTEFLGVGQTTPEAVNLFVIRSAEKSRSDASRQQSWKAIHYWVVTNKIASAVIVKLRPHLRVKARQADLVIALRKSKNAGFIKNRNVRTSNYGGRGRGLDPAIQGMRAALCAEIRSLNDTRFRRD